MKAIQPVPKITESFMDAVVADMGGRRLIDTELKKIPADNADYIIHNAICELKIFEEEPLEKKERQDELAAYFRENFLVSTEVDINIKHLNDDAKSGSVYGRRQRRLEDRFGRQRKRLIEIWTSECL